MKLFCLKCGSETIVKAGFMKGQQRYLCKNCRYQFVKTTPRGKPFKDKILVLMLYLSGVSMNMAGKVVGVSAQTAMRWINEFYHKYTEIPEPTEEIKELEIDELRHLLGKQSNQVGGGKFLTLQLKT